MTTSGRSGFGRGSAITAAALPLFHAFDATVMILVWNLGTGALIMGLGGLAAWRLGQ